MLKIPPNSTKGRTMRLKGRGLPGKPPGDFYAVLKIVLPPADTDKAKEVYKTDGARAALQSARRAWECKRCQQRHRNRRRPRSSRRAEEVTLADLTRTCRVHAEWVLELVEEGVLEPLGPGGPQWRFAATSVVRVQKAQRLQRDLGVNLPGIALALQLLTASTRWKRACAPPPCRRRPRTRSSAIGVNLRAVGRALA